ncbi:hypothetical protein ABT234_17280 [Streptomyces sp. NPDC001586]
MATFSHDTFPTSTAVAELAAPIMSVDAAAIVPTADRTRFAIN